MANRISVRERGAPTREEGVVFDLFDKHVNFISGGIVQGAGFIFGLELTTADLIKGIELRASALASTKLYRRFEGSVRLPKVGDEKTHAEIWFSYLRRTEDNFFGIGPLINDESQTNFDLEQRSYNGLFYRNFTDRFQAGVYVRVANSGSFNGENDHDIPMDQLFSGNPNVVPITSWAPGFQTNTKILSYGVYSEYDLRNNEHGLTKGAYLYGRFASADGLAYPNNPVFQDYGWLEGEMDARVYLPLLSDRTSLALRAYSNVHTPKGGSQIPFHDLSFLGGRMYLRGFPTYRFRANNSLLFSGELRQTVWKMSEQRGADLVVFADTGQVWGDNRSQSNPAVLMNKDFDSRNWRAGFGGSLQFRYSKNFALRIEAGASNERTLIYFSFSRGF
ncbi:MAG TPA: BamA/TamA family outer membrane protein [Pyrinomonadaceae bacterium]|nr:BamA/TamA family outer membrane protein [Pyrinomonadaceae bacterium]